MKFALFWLLVTGATFSMTASEVQVSGDPSGPGTFDRTIRSGNRLRAYRLHVPVKYTPGSALPLFLVFHGSSASPAVMERETSLNERADSMSFVVVYPQGLHRGWNAEECCRYSFMKGIDDIQFAADIIRSLSIHMSIDALRVYVTGYSDGGTLAYLIACRRPELIAGAASVGGTFYGHLPVCDLGSNVSIVNIHGTADKNVPYHGKTGVVPATERGLHKEFAAPEVVRFWVDRNKCDSLPTRATTDSVTRDSYSCEGSDVVAFTINGGEHGWPGGGRGWIFSPVPPKDLIATDTIARFFLAHSKQPLSPAIAK